jgi:Ca-activated chloride channel family protein
MSSITKPVVAAQAGSCVGCRDSPATNRFCLSFHRCRHGWFHRRGARAFSLIDENLDRTNFFAFGIGSSVNRYLIEGIARAGHGEPFVVTSPADASVAGERFRQYIESPVLTNIRVNYKGFDAYDVEPQKQADLFAERPIVLFGKWHGPKQGQIEVSGRTASGTFAKVFDVKDV